MNIRKMSAFIASVIMASSFCGCKKKVKSTGRMQLSQALSAEKASEETDDATIDGEQPLTDPDRILFTYEYRNNAWGYQYSVYVILGDGRCYYHSLKAGDFTVPEFSKEDIDSVIDLSSDM
ncbi:MAG TPA: hypothetical protein DCW43_01310, partial [Clostridiales bacterium]|nr:hypothetical protein [Clostridiales bacterium]